MRKKKILVFIDWYLPGYKAGGPIRSLANLISYLSDEFDFFIVTRDTDYMDSIPYDSVERNSWNKLPDSSKVFYISPDNLKKSVIRELIKDVNADVVYLNSIYSFYFTIIPLLIINGKTKLVIASRGMLAPGAVAIKPIKKKLFLFLSRIFNLFNNVIFQASSEEEKQHIESFFPKSKIEVVSNLPRKFFYNCTNNILKSPGEVRLLNISRVAPEKNLLYALQILKSAKGNIQFDFYGSIYDSDYWQQCKNAISILPPNVIATYKGIADSNQIFKLMENYHFLFLPSRGENFGHIILEAMSSGLPVIISNMTPWKNLSEKKAGWDIPLDSPMMFSEIIEECVLMDSKEYEVYSKGAHACALEYINDGEKILRSRQLFY